MKIFQLKIPFYRTELSDDWDNTHFAERFSKFVRDIEDILMYFSNKLKMDLPRPTSIQDYVSFKYIQEEIRRWFCPNLENEKELPSSGVVNRNNILTQLTQLFSLRRESWQKLFTWDLRSFLRSLSWRFSGAELSSTFSLCDSSERLWYCS